MKVDRRKGTERRAAERYTAAIDVDCQSVGGTRPGRVNDISMTGCYVLCGGDFDDGEKVRIDFPGMPLVGEVVNHVYDVGFGARFIDMSEPQQQYLIKLVEEVRSGS